MVYLHPLCERCRQHWSFHENFPPYADADTQNSQIKLTTYEKEAAFRLRAVLYLSDNGAQKPARGGIKNKGDCGK